MCFEETMAEDRSVTKVLLQTIMYDSQIWSVYVGQEEARIACGGMFERDVVA